MNKKLKIALYAIAFALIIAVLVLYVIFPVKTEYYFNCVKDFINRPLPIVGVSLAIAGGFIYKIILMTKFGQKNITALKNENTQLKEELLAVKEELLEVKESVEDVKTFAEETKDKMFEGFKLSSNVRIKGLAVHLDGLKDYIEESEESDNGEDSVPPID